MKDKTNASTSFNLSIARSTVIEKSINNEWVINCIISQHYIGDVRWPFIVQVLYDEYFSFALKRRILEKIIKEHSFEDKMIEQLNRLNSIRNYFAHCGQQVYRDGKIPTHGEKGVVPDPRKEGADINFSALYREFIEKNPAVNRYLFGILRKLGATVIKVSKC